MWSSLSVLSSSSGGADDDADIDVTGGGLKEDVAVVAAEDASPEGKKSPSPSPSPSPSTVASSAASSSDEVPIAENDDDRHAGEEEEEDDDDDAAAAPPVSWSEWFWGSSVGALDDDDEEGAEGSAPPPLPPPPLASPSAYSDCGDDGEGEGGGGGGYLASWYEWWYSSADAAATGPDGIGAGGAGGGPPVKDMIAEVKEQQKTLQTPQEKSRQQVQVDETAELIDEKLEELELELDKIPEEEKEAWYEAIRNCDEGLVGRDHRLMFLRCEVFRANKAAKRLVRYWSARLSIFGPSRAFRPLTLNDGALSDDIVALSIGFMISTERADPDGRRIVYFDPSKLDPSLYERESMVRALWYVVHAALEDETTQRLGAVLMLNHRDVSTSHFDPELVRLCGTSLRGCIPLRIASIHLFHLPYFINYVAPLFRYVLGERLWNRIVIHDGAEGEVMRRLDELYGMKEEDVPTDVGGGCELNQTVWLAERTERGL